MNNNKIAEIVFVCIFLCMIGASFILSIFHVNINESTNENRKKADRPTLTLTEFNKTGKFFYKIKGLDLDFKQYNESLETYYNDHFKVRSMFLSIFKYIKIGLLNVSTVPHKVVFAKNGWLFYGDEDGQALSESIGLVQFTNIDLLDIHQKVQEKKEYLSKQNIKYYVAIAPNKHSVYAHMIPIAHKNKNTKLEQLKKYMSDYPDIKIIDLKEYLVGHTNEMLYYKTGTHWNNYGAYYGYSLLCDEIGKDFPGLEKITLDKYVADSSVELDRGLAYMLDYQIEEKQVELKLKETSVANEIVYPGYCKYVNPNKPYKILIFRDSFFRAMLPFFIETFGEVILVRQPVLSKSVVEKEKPDIVINEYVERYIDAMKYDMN